MVKQHLWKLIVAVILAATLTAPGVSATSTVFQSPPPLPPANDNFANATVISGTSLSESVDVTAATVEAGEPTGSCGYAQHTAWYKFISPANGVVNYSLSGNNAVVNAYRADSEGFGGLSWPLDCAFSWGGSSWFNVQAGKIYYFQVGVDSSTGSTLNFSMWFTPAPINDDFANAKVISALPYDDNTNMYPASLEANEPTPSCGSTGRTIWYAYEPTASGLLSQQTNGAAYTVVAVYTGNSLSTLVEVACQSRSWYDGSYLTFHVNAGTTYYFQVGTGDNATVPFHLEVILPPVNDNFVDAKVITALPYDDNTDTTAASTEAGEPTPSCVYRGLNQTVWYAFTPITEGSVTANTSAYFATFLAAYSGTSLTSLTFLGCQNNGNPLTFHATAGTTYYFQADALYDWDSGGSLTFHLDVAPPPVADFYYYPGDPNVFDTIWFNNYSSDPANAGGWSQVWDFGDGATSTDYSPSHQYANDGDYTVMLKITTLDGRTASTSQVVHVRTHDIAITKFSAPQSASAGQTRQLVVGVNSKRYVENVVVTLYKSVPGGYQFVGTLQQTVPVRPSNRTTNFSFNYTFTKDDAAIGKVTFRAVATLVNARDALPADNEAIASPTKVGKK